MLEKEGNSVEYQFPSWKKDGSWRSYVDYRELNKNNSKHKFLVLVIKELLDEVASSTVYSKIDLRFGYHWIRMQEDDVFRTTFIYGAWVENDPRKINAIVQWPQASSEKDTRSFLGLTRYYRRFIRSYAMISRPFIDMLKNNGFIRERKQRRPRLETGHDNIYCISLTKL